jgi:predicted metal-dependent phosphoesterase TrpH
MEYKYETHLHTRTSSACAIVSPAAQVRKYKELGYTGIIVTDHFGKSGGVVKGIVMLKKDFRKYIRKVPKLAKDVPRKLASKANKELRLIISINKWRTRVEYLYKGYKKAKAAGDRIGLDVFLGWEYHFQGTDILTYGLGIDFLRSHKELRKISLERYSELVRENGGYLAQAHPYRADLGKNKLPRDPRLLDGVEVFNADRHGKYFENEMAAEFARFHNLPTQAGTDSHEKNCRLYSGIILPERAGNIQDIISAIKSKDIKLILPDGDRAFRY